ncbi:hypothetical protein KAR91_28700 [Candidatus Pacearchaeota archaeon]|nr:hypothetical protein [Candidatus Pacearchaeota archaeon]
MANLYDYDYGRENTDLPNVIGHTANYSYDSTDTCTIRLLTDEREEWRDILYGQQIRVVRKSDSFVEFRGDIKEIRLNESDRYNLTLHVRDPTWRLGELDVKRGNGQLRVPRTITALPDATSIIDTGGADEPPDDEPVVYTSGDNVVMIVPSDTGTFTNELVEDSVTTKGAQVGDYDDLNDLDPDTYAGSSADPDTSEWVQFNGSSANAKAQVIGVKYKVLAKAFISDKARTMKLQYRDDDGSTWIDLHTEDFNDMVAVVGFWTPYYTIEGSLWVNTFLDGSDDWRFRILITPAANDTVATRISSVEINIYTDNVHSVSYFPIDSFADASTDLTVSADPDNSLTPTTAGVAVGDTYIIGEKNEDLLNSIFAYNAKNRLPFIRSVDTNFSGYTAKDFVGGTILDAVEYFCDREVAHWYYNHDTNYLEIDKESTILTAGEHEIVAGNVDTFSLEKKTDANVRSVTVWGKTYRREPDEEEVTAVAFTYPDDALNKTIAESSIYSLKNLQVDDVSINSRSEAAKLAISIYSIRNTVSPTIKVQTNTFEDVWLGERLKLTLDGKVYDTTYPISGININHNVGNNDITQTVTGGWQRTPLIKRHGGIIRSIAKDVRSLHMGQRGMKVPAKKVVVADGTVGLSDVTITNLQQEGTGVDNSNGTATGQWTMQDWQRFEGSIIFAADSGDSAPSTLTGTDDSNNVEFDGDFSASNGSLAATTLSIGDQVISEGDELIVKDAATPGIRFEDTGATAAGGAKGRIYFQDNVPATMGDILVNGTHFYITHNIANADMRFELDPGGAASEFIWELGHNQEQMKLKDGALYPGTDNDLDLGLAGTEFKDLFIDGTAHIDTLDVDVDATGITLSMIENTTADKTFTFANKGIKFAFTGVNPGAYDGMFELEMTGNLQADVMHIHQHTGNVVAGSKLLHLHGSDADLLELEISGQGPVLSIQDTGDSDEELLAFDTTARTLRVGAADGNDDIATSIYGSLVVEGNDILAHLMIGAANETFIPCVVDMEWQNRTITNADRQSIRPNSATDPVIRWTLPMPTNRGGLKLYINTARVDIFDADAQNYLDHLVIGQGDFDTQNDLLSDGTNRTAQGRYDYDLSNADCGAYSIVTVQTNLASSGANLLDLIGVSIGCYYA